MEKSPLDFRQAAGHLMGADIFNQQQRNREERMKRLLGLLLFIALTTAAGDCFAAGAHRIGGGATYWVAIEDIEFEDEKVDDDGFSFLASYQYWPSLFGLEIDVEFLPDRFGESAVAPEAYLLIGRTIYGGLGIGMIYSDGNFADEPFYAIKAGLNLELLPGLYADIYGNYRFNDSAEFDKEDTDIDTDTVFLGAALRIGF